MADSTEVLLLKVQTIVEGQSSLIALAQDLKNLESSQVAAAKAQATATQALTNQLTAFAQQQAQVAAQTQALSAQRLAAAERLIGISSSQSAMLLREAEATSALTARVAALPAKQIAVASTTAAVGVSFLSAVQAARLFADATRGAGDALRSILDTGFEDERLQTQFTILTGSADAARRRLEDLRQFSTTFGLDFHGVTEAAAILDRVGITGPRALQAVADASAATGKSLTTVAEALAGVSRGNLRGFLDLVPAASSAVLQASNEIEAGAKKTPVAIRYLVDQATADLERFKGGAARAAQDTKGELTSLGNRFSQLQGEIYAAGIDDAARTVLGAISSEIEKLKTDGTLDEWAKELGDAARAGAEGLKALIELTPKVVDGLEKLRIPIGFLVGAIGLQKIAGLALVATTSIAELGVAAAAAGGGVAVLDLAITALGGPIVIAIGLVGGLIGAMVFDGSRAEVDALRKHYEDLDDTLRRTASHADEVAKSKAAAPERDSPFAGPVAAVADARSALAADYGIQPGQSFSDFRMQTAAAAKVIKPPAKADPAAKQAADEAHRQAEQLLADVEKVEKEATDIVLREVQRRITASGAEGEERIRLLNEYAAEELAKAGSNGAVRAQLETELETRIAARRAEIAAAPFSDAERKRQNADLDTQAAAGQQAIAIAFSTANAEAAARRSVWEQSNKDRDDIERHAALERGAEQVADARFERDLFGLTTSQYIEELNRRLASLGQFSIEAKAIAKEIARSQASDGGEDAIVGRAVQLEKTGLSPQAANTQANAEAEAKAIGEFQTAQDNAVFLARVALLDSYQGLHDKSWDQMNDKEKQVHLQSLELAKQQTAGTVQLYQAIQGGAKATADFGLKQAKTLFDFHDKSGKADAARLQVIGFLTQKNAKEAVAAAMEQVSGELRALAILDAAKALEALGEGLLGHPGGFAAAAKFAESAALAGGGAIATAGIARSERAAIAADDQRQNQVAAGAAPVGGSSGPDSTRLTVSQGNQPITMQFYNSVSIEGGTVFLDRAGARLIVDQLADAINEGIANGQIRVGK